MKDINYITIQGWMRTKLNLKGNELITYALIYGFTQDEDSWFSGSSSYVANWLGIEKRNALEVLKKLTEKGLIIKQEKIVNGTKLVDYRTAKTTNTPGDASITPGDETSPPPGDETSPHNNNKDNTRVHSVHSSTSPDGEVDSFTTLTQGGFAAVLDSFSVSGKKREAVLEFIKMRKLIKKPMTPHALELALKNLDKLASDEGRQIAILEQSIANSWQGLFPLRNESSSTPADVFDYEDLPKSFRAAYEDEGLQWSSSLPKICSSVVRLQQWYKDKRDDHAFAEKNARSNWSSLTFSAKTFWKSFLEYMYNVIGDNPPQPAHFDPKGNMFGSWAREMEIKL